MWSTWPAWLLGRRLPRELVEAAAPLDFRARARARRAVRRGEAAEEVPVARYAVALARREQRRRPSRPVLLVCAAMACLSAFFALRNLGRHGLNGDAIFFAIAALLIGWLVVRVARGLRSAPAAELANMRFLEHAGQPYPQDADPHPAPLPREWLATLVSLPVTFLIYDLVYGLLSQLTDGKPVTLERVVARGATWALLMTIFMTAWKARRDDERDRSLTAGTDGRGERR